MGKSTAMDSQNYQKYGVPLYGAAWVPHKAIRSDLQPDNNSVGHDGDESPASDYLVLAGGGGEGRSGISNAVLIAGFDLASNSLSSSPVGKLGTGADLPYRMALHPNGEGLICSFIESCRWFEWDTSGSHEDRKLGLKVSDNLLKQLEEVGQQLALVFSDDGSMLATGGQKSSGRIMLHRWLYAALISAAQLDGKLRVFKWPGMEAVISEEQAHSTVKDLDFSLDGKFLVSVGGGGPCRVWDVTSSKVVASLPKENDEVFGYCRFSQKSDGNQVLYTTNTGGSIVSWNTSSWRRIASKRFTRDSVSAFSVSNDGKLLAMALVSASMDSSVRVTIIEDKTKTGQTLSCSIHVANIGFGLTLNWNLCVLIGRLADLPEILPFGRSGGFACFELFLRSLNYQDCVFFFSVGNLKCRNFLLFI
ncbi:hypothetical protein Dimus_031070 [Dionaea muscipula]